MSAGPEIGYLFGRFSEARCRQQQDFSATPFDLGYSLPARPVQPEKPCEAVRTELPLQPFPRPWSTVCRPGRW